MRLIILKKYNMNSVYSDKLEIKDIFDMKNFFINKYCYKPPE